MMVTLYKEAAPALQEELADGECRFVIAELTRQNNRMAIIQQIAKSINVEMTYEEIINEVAVPLRSVLSYDLLSFCLLEKERLIIKASIPKEQEILGEGWVLHSNNSTPGRQSMKNAVFCGRTFGMMPTNIRKMITCARLKLNQQLWPRCW